VARCGPMLSDVVGPLEADAEIRSRV